MNACRQARALGTYLIVGLNNFESIKDCKGEPVLNDDARLEAVKAVKWVDEVLVGTPYVMSEEYLRVLMQQYRIDYVVHGDDLCVDKSGQDVYRSAKKIGQAVQ